VRKKLKNQLNRKIRKKKLKNINRERKLIKILKKPTGSVWFWFYKTETEKTESKPKKPEKTRAKPV
jgi:hypothetical protein